MQMVSIKKAQFAGLSDKRYYFSDSITSFNSPFDLLHADIEDLRFLAKSAVDPKYCLLFIDLFTQKIYTYPMKKEICLPKKRSCFTKI